MNTYIESVELKTLGYDFDEDDLKLLDDICRDASSIVDSYCLQSLQVANYKEIILMRVNSCKGVFAPTRKPLQQIVSVIALDHGVKGTNLRVGMYETGVCDISVGNGLVEIAVEYIYGFKEIPYDIKQATRIVAAQLLDRYFVAKNAGYWGMDSMSEGEVSLGRAKEDIPSDAVKRMLNRYRRVR